MNLDFLDYELPQELIAQQPCPERDQARLMVVRRTGTELQSRVFHDLLELLSPGRPAGPQRHARAAGPPDRPS
jgi:S-adenosylmethionine:tRNA ribosyltransferase-isomerase